MAVVDGLRFRRNGLTTLIALCDPAPLGARPFGFIQRPGVFVSGRATLLRMKLTDLNPRWIGSGGEGVSDGHGNPVPERNGVAIVFDCPVCGPDHPLCIEFNNPLDGNGPHDSTRHLWTRAGETFAVLTLTPSIQRMEGCRWHGFVTDGQIVTC